MRFYDREDVANPLNGSDADSAEALLRLVDAHQERRPFFAELVGTGFKLLVGVGGPTGCAQYSPANGNVPYLMAVNPTTGSSSETDFLIGGTPTPVLARYCLPSRVVRELIRHFAETGKPSPMVEWEEI